MQSLILCSHAWTALASSCTLESTEVKLSAWLHDVDKLHPWDKKTHQKKELFFPFDLLWTQTQESEASMVHSPVSSYFISGRTRSDGVTTAAESRCIWDRLGVPVQKAAKPHSPSLAGAVASLFQSSFYFSGWMHQEVPLSDVECLVLLNWNRVADIIDH